MKLNSKIFSKSLILETKQMAALKGGSSWTQCGSNNAGLNNSTRDWKGDSSTTCGTVCGLADTKFPTGTGNCQ